MNVIPQGLYCFNCRVQSLDKHVVLAFPKKEAVFQ